MTERFAEEAPVTMLRVYLDVARSVRDDEFPVRRGKVSVSDVNGDALLAFGAKTVGKIRQVDLAASRNIRRALERLELIFHQRFGIIEQPADERGFSVIDGPAGVEAEKVDMMMERDGHARFALKVAGLLAVFHGGFGRLVVGAGASLGYPGDRNFRDDVVNIISR